MAEPIIRFAHFGFQYDAQAEPTLYDISLDIAPGEKVLVVGPSGSGKSTLSNCINGLIPFSYKGESTGLLRVNDEPAKDQSIFKLAKTVGTVLQDTDGQFVGLTVAEDIAFSMENDCASLEEMRQRVRKAAALVGIDTHLDHSPQDLSGGQKQRVSMAGVLVDDVGVLLFDEPLANLDPLTGKQTIEHIGTIQQSTGATVLMIEHRLEDALHRPVDRIVLIDEGRIVADLPPAALLCTDLLAKTGIREPLYLTALRYAGVPFSADNHPEHIDALALDETAKEAVRRWYRETKPAHRAAGDELLLEVQNIDFEYIPGKPILKDISFSLNRSEMVAIVGENGAGKSTLSKVICGFEKENAGFVRMQGRDLAGDTIVERARRIGYVMQNPNQMISKILIYDEVALALQQRGDLPEEEIRARVEETLKICGLYPFRNWPISALSFGQKKRVTIAAVLVQSPEILLLDEPTAGQDFRHYTEIMEFLQELNRQGVTVVMITHDMHLMLEYADRALVLSGGALIADLPAAAVLTSPELTARASLKETSLYRLAQLCGIEDGTGFVQHFIDYDREVRGHV